MVFHKNYTCYNQLNINILHVFQCIVHNRTIHVQVAEYQNVLKKHVGYV